ncbi:uncharacterized protein LDX57_005254 [Aspergillus melleus]|uniref:uncharacterized protein n=1 Tax=Aspergillus melleus TaxID=138277 RepID=UPI001E8E6295|nr:uncharacterized protein LDX57_005254 [Aspergillus melleus]KAH8427541.1 hypothetical protein LDX57_005254 [Aspergillus melleus]
MWIAGLAAIVTSLELDIRDSRSLIDAAATTVENMFSNSTSLNGKFSPLLTGHKQPDEDMLTFDEGMLYLTLIQFWNATEIASYNSLINKRLRKPLNDSDAPITLERTQNQALGAWGLASITAAEMNYPELDDKSSWLQVASHILSVLTSQTWDVSTCRGGLRMDWEWFPKDALSNGLFFQLAARLAHATSGDESRDYARWANEVWEWSVISQILDEKNWSVIMSVTNSTEGGACSPYNLREWSYAYGLYLNGAAYMYKATNGLSWKERANGLLQSTMERFFIDNIMTEFGPRGSFGTNETIINNMKGMVGLLSASLVTVANLLPETAEQIVPRLRATAVAAAKQCSGSANGTVCGSEWTKPTYDGNPGLGSSMSAANLFVSILMLPEGQEKKLSDGEIAGIAVGSGAGVAIIATAIFLLVRRRGKGKKGVVSDSEYSPCHSDRSEDVSGVTEDTSELPASKDGGTSVLRHELDSNNRATE